MSKVPTATAATDKPTGEAAAAPPAAKQPATSLTVSRGFADWLRANRTSFAFTSYQTGQLFLVGVTPNVSLCNVGSGPATICSFSSSLTGNFSASAVPEPASWAMMVGGFGLLGATMRRRKPSVAVRIG